MSAATTALRAAAIRFLGPELADEPGAKELVKAYLEEKGVDVETYGRDSTPRHHGSQKVLDSKERYTK